MADLPEVENYDVGVYQKETTDAAMGGAAGKANAGILNLANRTKWLKARVDELIAIVVQATESVKGIAEIATQAETNTGTDDTRIVSPKKLKSGFLVSLTTNGYIVFPAWMGGLVVQWGIDSTLAGSVTVNFPIAFPAVNFTVMITDSATNDNGIAAISSNKIDIYSFTAYARKIETYELSATEFKWLAIGY